jgi:hypothetical protein
MKLEIDLFLLYRVLKCNMMLLGGIATVFRSVHPDSHARAGGNGEPVRIRIVCSSIGAFFTF